MTTPTPTNKAAAIDRTPASTAIDRTPASTNHQLSTYNCEIPDWLQQCLDERQQEQAIAKEETGVVINSDRLLIANAFQLAYDLHG
jgi:hypothetical protein